MSGSDKTKSTVNRQFTRSKNGKSNVRKFLKNNVSILLSTVLSLVANWLVFNIIAIFSIRNITETIYLQALKGHYVILEVGLFLNVCLYGIVCAVTGTKFKHDESVETHKLDNRGILKYKAIHESFWSTDSLSYSNAETVCSGKSSFSPVSKTFEIRKQKLNKEADTTVETTEVEVISPMDINAGKETEKQCKKEYKSKTEKEQKHEHHEPAAIPTDNTKVETSSLDELDQPRRHFSFHRRYKRPADSESVYSRASNEQEGTENEESKEGVHHSRKRLSLRPSSGVFR
ncbi:Piso0_005204 [Millerozyma farinosa CBS 7064]|uniref:Piso0_005204 protein n=1 Tax=Pichia sorbitophila (strain ATCC MYA-4447 / BCRC 22081 / CBS 7064 / NBRC 10061 / NRRL Y-12695) TaxID=559304 RepID=G8Y4H4_PICSO|nr:Piso0_005204 [Millerozyma farinosa CBS 7064]